MAQLQKTRQFTTQVNYSLPSDKKGELIDGSFNAIFRPQSRAETKRTMKQSRKLMRLAEKIKTDESSVNLDEFYDLQDQIEDQIDLVLVGVSELSVGGKELPNEDALAYVLDSIELSKISMMVYTEVLTKKLVSKP